MPFQPVEQCTMCELRWQVNTNLCENTFAYKWNNTTPPTASELAALAQEVGGTIALRMRNMLCNNVVLREVYCKNLNTQFANQGSWQFPPNTTGNRIAAPVALNEAAGLVKRTGLTGRANRGRNSFSGFAESDVDGNSLAQQILQTLVDVALSVLAQRVAGRFLPAVASKSRGVAVLLTSATSLDSNIDSQKTRLNSHGT